MALIRDRHPGARRPSSDLVRATRMALAVGALVAVVAGCLPGSGRGPGPAATGDTGASAAASPSGPTPHPTIVAPTPTPAPTFRIHVVAGGESLNVIAHRYGTTARSIAFWSRTKYPSLDPDSPSYKPGLLQAGWTLFLIPNLVYDEESGDAVDPSGALPAP